MALCVPPTLLHFSVNPILCCRRASRLEAQAATARRRFDCEPGMGQTPVHFKSQMFKFEIPPPGWSSAFTRSGRRVPKPCPNRLKPELQTQAGMNCI